MRSTSGIAAALLLLWTSGIASCQTRITTMADDALESAYPGERRDLDFDSGRFSPTGVLFALVLKDVTLGGPEQVWLYDTRSRRLVPVTETPHQSVAIKDIVWGSDDTLYISADHITGSGPFFVRATMTEAKNVSSPPSQIAETFVRRARDSHRGYPQPLRERRNESYVVRAINQGHGDIMVQVRRAGGTAYQQIARGSWELVSFLFDGARSEVLYPDWIRGGIIALSLREGRARSLVTQPGGNVYLLDSTEHLHLVAYSSYGPCGAKPDYSNRVQQARRVCFANLQ